MKTPLQRIRLGGLVLVATIIVATFAYRLAGWDWLDAIYMIVITVATVGFGEHSQLSPAEQWITMGVVVVGITAAVISLGGFAQMMIEGEIERALNVGRTTRAIQHLENHVVLCGFGRIGRILAGDLQQRHQSFLVIDSTPEAVGEAQSLNYLVLSGDATEEATLRTARVEHACTLVTALPSDAANVFITLTARNLNRDLQIIARGEHPSTEKKLLQAGANRVVLPAAIGAHRIASIITRPSTIELLELVSGQSTLDVEVDEIQLAPHSSLVGKTAVDAETRRRHGLLVVAIKQQSGTMVFNPGADIAYQAGDKLIVMGRCEDIDRFRREYNT
ncbi:MAG: TrkA family potassium uptake protein [Pirellulales bacterium]